MATLCCIVATAQSPSHGSAAGGACVCPSEFMASCDSSSEMDIQGSILLNIPELFLHRKLLLSPSTDGWRWYSA